MFTTLFYYTRLVTFYDDNNLSFLWRLYPYSSKYKGQIISEEIIDRSAKCCSWLLVHTTNSYWAPGIISICINPSSCHGSDSPRNRFLWHHSMNKILVRCLWSLNILWYQHTVQYTVEKATDFPTCCRLKNTGNKLFRYRDRKKLDSVIYLGKIGHRQLLVCRALKNVFATVYGMDVQYTYIRNHAFHLRRASISIKEYQEAWDGKATCRLHIRHQTYIYNIYSWWTVIGQWSLVRSFLKPIF